MNDYRLLKKFLTTSNHRLFAGISVEERIPLKQGLKLSNRVQV
jgi:hypothetical protein